ncbi:acyl-CoA dehydrogenase-like protein [Williamsia limnetica]|jgi:alkylation response protein AidB-like acyl-CoA dehydrogenase|uniref:Acyl-CoA dehydrogenase-like protein n=1 Tax=Williamsia limnetica TaxID=882452 RepID=A0A318RUG8_WILLI|nr:acyl-CoA dehydrogenase family protein [Williamsia limnetica]PYE16390.1 acyl-CoA dehydrogenase-like protein [Williamsia limnetica]
MDVRLTSEQRQLRDAASKLADDLGPSSVSELDDETRIVRLEKVVDSTGWRDLRSDGASAVEVAIVVEEFARGLVDVPFVGPVLADDALRHVAEGPHRYAMVVDGAAFDARGFDRGVVLDGNDVNAVDLGLAVEGVDLTRRSAPVAGAAKSLGELTEEQTQRHHALSLVTTCAELVGASRGAHATAVEYAKIREQYGNTIGSYQAVAHLLAEGLALIEGSISVLRHAAWAVDELEPEEAIKAATIAKLYCARTARTVCETAIQVHGGIGNTWECLVHVYLRRSLTSTELFPVSLEEIHIGLP